MSEGAEMWQTRSGMRIFLPLGGLSRLIPQLKRIRHLWLVTTRHFRGSLRHTLWRLLRVLSRRAVDRGIRRAADGRNYRLLETHLAGRLYELWTTPSGALIAIRDRRPELEFEFEGEPGPSANNVHEQVIGYLNGLFANAGYEVRVDKDLGQMVNGAWKSQSKLRPDLQVTDKRTGKTFYVEVDSDPSNGDEHRRQIQQKFPGATTILIGYDHARGAPTFATAVDTKGASSKVQALLKDMNKTNWKVLDIFRAMKRARLGQNTSGQKKVQRGRQASQERQRPSRQQQIAQLRGSRSNRPPNISGAVRQAPGGGRHRESEHFSEMYF